MTTEYKKYYQMIFSAIDGVNPRFWNKIRNKLTIDNNSIVLLPSRKGILVYAAEDSTPMLFTDLSSIKKYINETKPNIFDSKK